MPDASEESKPSWGDMMEEGDGDVLPPPSEIVEGNVKKMIEYKYDEDGKKVKITRVSTLKHAKFQSRLQRERHGRSLVMHLVIILMDQILQQLTWEKRSSLPSQLTKRS